MALGTLNTYLVESDEDFDESARAQRWFLTFAIPNTDWFTLGTMIGQPVFGATSAVTANAPIFAAWMVGSYMEFTESGNQYPVVGFTSSTVLTLTGDASTETADDTFTVVHGYRVVPDRGDLPPAAPNSFPDKLDIGGSTLKRRVRFKERPGFVILRVTYGFDAAVVADNSSFITMRTILVEQELNFSFDDPRLPLTGRVFIADKPSKRVYGVKNGPVRIERPYQILRIYALLDEDGRTEFAKPLIHKATALNDDSWTFGGMTFPKNTLKFRGVSLDYSRRWGTSATNRIYNTVFEFVERVVPWPLKVDRYEWEAVILKADEVDDDANVIGQGKLKTLKAIDSTKTAVVIRAEFGFDTVLGSSTIGGKLIS